MSHWESLVALNLDMLDSQASAVPWYVSVSVSVSVCACACACEYMCVCVWCMSPLCHNIRLACTVKCSLPKNINKFGFFSSNEINVCHFLYF